MNKIESNQVQKRQRAALTRQALLYGGLAVAALMICAVNLVAIVGVLWQPSRVLALPIYMMFAAVSLWACVSFLQTRSKVLYYRDHPDLGEDESVEVKS